MNLPEALLRAVEDLGFESPTPIQAKALPLLLEGKDVAGQAQTGTGKTACFLLAAMTRLLESERPSDGSPRALIVAPTRELAIQIARDAEGLGAYADLKTVTCYGGTNWEGQANSLRAGCDIVVGTPGRLIDYCRKDILRLNRIQSFILDEADRMFDMGFIKDVNYLFRKIPRREQRQALLFSATLSQAVMRLAWRYMVDPVEVSVAPDQIVVEEIEQSLYHVSSSEKCSLLLGLFAAHKPKRAMIFVNMKRTGEELCWRLNQNGYQAVYMSGDVAQKKRQRIIDALKEGKIDILVATDVASRGIHVDDISHVFNFDIPEDPEDYVHRIGRTARAGATGTAITLACENYVMGLPQVEKYTGKKIPVSYHDDDGIELVEDRAGYFRRRRGFTYCGWPLEGQGQGQGQQGQSAKPSAEGGKKRKRKRRSRKGPSDAPAAATQASTKPTDSKAAGQRPKRASTPKSPGDTPSPRRTRVRRRIGEDANPVSSGAA